MPDAERSVRFVYSRATTYHVVPATGVYGGATPTGGIKFDFMVEYATEPNAATHAVGPDGSLSEELERQPPQKTITRELQVGVVMSLEDAETFERWLSEKIMAIRVAKKSAS